MKLGNIGALKINYETIYENKIFRFDFVNDNQEITFSQTTGNYCILNPNDHAIQLEIDLTLFDLKSYECILLQNSKTDLNLKTQNKIYLIDFKIANFTILKNTKLNFDNYLEVKNTVDSIQFNNQYVCILKKYSVINNLVSIINRQIKEADQQHRQEQNYKLESITEYIHENYYKNISIHQLSTHFGLNESQLKAHFKKHFNTTIYQYIIDYRIVNSKHLLLNTHYCINEISYKCGYENTSSFIRVFKNKVGISPEKFRLKNQ